MPVQPPLDHRNEVLLVGRVAAEPIITVLPSGDEVVVARLVVERPRPAAGRGRRARVDAVSCSAWIPDVRRRVRSWSTGDVVEVSGALRRRFWRGDGGPRSRYEVEMSSATRLARGRDDELTHSSVS